MKTRPPYTPEFRRQMVELVRAGRSWVHEIKHDGYRLIVRRDGKTARLFTRRGYEWTESYPAIAAVAAKLRAFHHARRWFACKPPPSG
jgi:ATP-dependent DNA ligase